MISKVILYIPHIIEIGLIVILAVSSFTLTFYLQFQPREAYWIFLFLLSLLSSRSFSFKQFKTKEIIGIGIFCLLLAVSLILGYHISINGNTYAGIASNNYILPYSVFDAVALLLMLPCLLLFGLKTYSFIASPDLSNNYTNPKLKKTSLSKHIAPLQLKHIILLALIPFICWIPYLLIYWPGFIFGDTLSSLAQAVGSAPYSNHHPFLYTIFIKCCLNVSNIIGFGNTGGCVLYCLIQMGGMAFVFSYLAVWIKTRCDLKFYWSLVLVLIFSLSPYVATYSIAMWKDPIFSVTLVLITVLLMDFILSRGSILIESKSWLPLLIGALLVSLFSRNNGIYIAICIEFALALVYFLCRKHFSASRNAKRAFAITSGSIACVIALGLIITGPVYKALGVAPSEKVESVGILLNQMARVAALDGDMTESDREYLNSILPIEQYETVYTPTCTDNLKWNPSFNGAALENDFFKHWLSLFIQNPRAYFEAWELQTFGFWAVDEPHAITHGNISGGVPRNTAEAYAGDLDAYQINAENKLGSDIWRDIFPQDNQSIPISFIFWGLLYLSVCLVLRGKGLWLVALVPSLALLATLIVASPIWYWPRYGAAVQFLIPFYVAIVVLMRQEHVAKEIQ